MLADQGSALTRDRGVGINCLSPTSESIVYRTGPPIPVKTHRASVLHQEKTQEVYAGQSRNEVDNRQSCPSFVVDKAVDESIEGGRVGENTSRRPVGFAVPTLGTDARYRDGTGTAADVDSQAGSACDMLRQFEDRASKFGIVAPKIDEVM